MSRYMKMAKLIGYDILLVIALIGNVCSFRGFWNVIEAYFMTGEKEKIIGQTICQCVGLFYMFVFYAGTSLHGGVRRDDESVMAPNFFLTYLLCNKLD